MSVTTRPVGTVSHPESDARTLSPLGAKLLAVLRIAFGLTFLWAFFDKLIGLGFATKPESAWLRGGDPTYGYLTNSPEGPFAGFYHSLAGQTWVTWLFMISLLAIGIALVLGIGLRITAIAGGLLYLMMWSVALPPTTNPVIDDHLLGLISLAVFAATSAGLTWGLSSQWRSISFVAKHHWLW